MRVETAVLAGFLATFGGAVIPLPALAEVTARQRPELPTASQQATARHSLAAQLPARPLRSTDSA